MAVRGEVTRLEDRAQLAFREQYYMTFENVNKKLYWGGKLLRNDL
jgi:hypothetical protein